MKKPVKLKDVAKYAGVGVGTASRVLNGQSNVSEEKRERVLQAMKDLNYRPNAIARSLKTQSTRTIGIILMDITNSFYSGIFRGMEEKATEAGYHLLLADMKWDMGELEYTIRTMKDKNVDGIIFLGGEVDDQMAGWFKDEGLPIVFISTDMKVASKEHLLPRSASINIDNEAAAYDATTYLIKKGFRDVAVITGFANDNNSTLIRLRGYKKAMKDRGVLIRDCMVRTGSFTYESGYRVMGDLLDCTPQPSAVFVMSDVMAMGAIKAIISRGYKVPEDIAVIGFDGIEQGLYYHPSLTTIKQPTYEMGKQGIEMLIQLIDGALEGGEDRILSYQLVERESC